MAARYCPSLRWVAQELLLILDEYWGKHMEYQKYPIYYASNLARKYAGVSDLCRRHE